MRIEKLRELHQARPFRPFVIRIADGRTLAVPRSEFLAYDPAGSMGVVLRTNGTFSILDLDLMTELEVLPVNGKKQGKTGK